MKPLLLASLLVLVSVVGASAKEAGKPGYYFSTGSNALSWDSDELARVRFLHHRSFNDPDKYLKSSDLASYLGLAPINGLHLPVPLNVVLIGFNKDGNKNLKLRPEELQAWFETLDHILPHVRVPFSEVTCKEDGYCVDWEKTEKLRPLHSYVHYNISVHAIEVESTLAREFSNIVAELARPMQFGHEEDRNLQVDVTSLESVLDGLLAELGLVWSYNIILINPKKKHEEGYMYRAGLSEMEIDLLATDPLLLKKVRKEANMIFHRIPPMPGADLVGRAWHPPRPKEKFDTHRILYESTRWAEQTKKWIMDRSRIMDQTPKDLVKYKSLLTLRGIHADLELSHLLDTISKNENRQKMTALRNLRVMEPEEGCPTDAWAGHHRWVMMDFSSNAQHWGPLAGGDGFKTQTSIPSIEAYFGKDPNFENTALKEDLLAHKSKRVQHLQSFRTGGEVPMEVLKDMELEVFTKFKKDHCDQKFMPPSICEKVDLAVTYLQDYNHVFTTEKGMDLLATWLADEGDDGEIGYHKDTRIKDLFLAHTSSMISKALRHIFLPPTLAWYHGNDKSKQFQYSRPFARVVNFHMYILSDPTIDNSVNGFDLANFKKELMSIKLDKQDFQFSVQKVSILHDHELSTSLSATMRSVLMEQVGADLSFESEERVYFDSKELQYLLKRRFIRDVRQAGGLSEKQGHIDVPIFIFCLDRILPVFIDQHATAKALNDMVIVVENSQYRWQHPLGIACAGNIVGQTLSAPLKAALAATLQHLGGLLPPHLGYSPSHQAITHDWMWSIGANPFSFTSPGWKISQAQKDAVHRSYLLDAIDLSVEQVNYGIYLLQEVIPSERSFEVIKKESNQLAALLHDYGVIVEIWREMVNEMGKMQFQLAMDRLHAMEVKSSDFLHLAYQLNWGLKPLKCLSSSNVFWGIRWLSEELIGGLLFLLILGGLLRFMTKKRKKKSF